MADQPLSTAMKSGNTMATPPAPKRAPGHRAVDAQDAIAELTERAQEISREAGSKVSAAMKDVISAAAGIAGFAVESARDLVQYMVRRGQMTQEEADKLIREAEAAQVGRPAPPPRPAPPRPAAPPIAAAPVEAAPFRAPAPPVRSPTPAATKAVAHSAPAKAASAPAVTKS